jgi:poly-gamma-glutamate capsule biosynthesis protein CapA/YwtB (metallophosphatase superfamily)
MKPITFLIGGDIAPTRSNFSYFSEGKIEDLVDQDLLNLLSDADYRIYNLEEPLSDISKPIQKDGPNLIAPESAINGIKLLNPSILGLANNHIMDHDAQGLNSTIEQLSKNNIQYVGAGKDLADAAKPLIIEENGIKIGVYACAEYEFSIAGENKAGANPFDPLESPDHISHLKSLCDFVIVLYHGGKELYRYPSPYLKKVCRKMAEKGADLVICQHTHCIGAEEKYQDSTIVYGQGNFLFDLTDNEFWQTSLIVKATFSEKLSVDYIPIHKKGKGVALSDPDMSNMTLNAFYQRSEQIAIPGFIENEYQKFCIDNGLYYLGAFAGFGRILRKINGMLGGIITKQIYSLKKLNMLQNFIECEAHRELFITYLQILRRGK